MLLGVLVGLSGMLGLAGAVGADPWPAMPLLPSPQNVRVNLDLGSSISLNCPRSVAMPEIMGIGDVKADFLCTVTSTMGRGYVIDVHSMTDLVKNGEASPTDRQRFVPDVGKMNAIKAGAWAISADGGGTWQGAGSRLVTAGRQGFNDRFNFTLGLHAGADDGLTAFMESGDYEGRLVLTATILL